MGFSAFVKFGIGLVGFGFLWLAILPSIHGVAYGDLYADVGTNYAPFLDTRDTLYAIAHYFPLIMIFVGIIFILNDIIRKKVAAQ